MTDFVLSNNRHKRGVRHIIATLFVILAAPAALAESVSVSQQVTEQALLTLNEKAEQSRILLNANRIEATITPAPDNLRLRPCDSPLKTTLMTESHTGPQRLQLRCQSPNNWTVHIRGNINVYTDVLISQTQLTRGMRPSPDNIAFEERNISDLRRGYLLSYEQLENMTAARRIRPGEIIIPSMLEPELIIQRGDRVNLVAGSGDNTQASNSFFISTPGEAMNNGALNQQIRVRNLGSGRIVSGTVISRTEVRVE